MSEKGGEHFGLAIGKMLVVEADSDGWAWNKPLLRGKWLRVDGQQLWISFKYERSQSFCFHCGVLNHKGRGAQSKE